MQTATNPATGEKLMLQNGAWVPMGANVAPAQSAPMVVGTPRPKAPEVRQVGSQLGIVDPTTGGFTPTYTAPEKVATPKDPKVTADERSAAGYLRRMVNADTQYGEGVAPRGIIAQTAIDVLPDNWANTFNDDDRRAAENYADEFIRAKLRKESGAAIPPEERAQEYPVYFPMPGDEAADLERKAGLRRVAIEGMRFAAGAEADRAVEGLAPRSAPNGDVPPDGSDEHIYDPTMGRRGPSVAAGETLTDDDPTLAGVNDRINTMLKSGASDTEIMDWIDRAGVGKTSVLNVLQWRKDHPQYKGNYRVNVDDREVPNTALSQVAGSAPGAAVIAAADTLTGGHLDNIIGATGGNAELASAGIAASRDANPYASLAGDVVAGAGLYGGARAGLAAAGRLGAPATGALSPTALAGDAALGGYVASGQGGTDIIGDQTLMGAGLGMVGGAAGRGVINGIASTVSPTGGALRPIYDAGGRPTVGQRMGAAEGPISGPLGRSMNRVEQAFSSVPLVGGIQRASRNASIDQMQRGAFNESLKEIGLTLPDRVSKGVVAHRFAQKAFDDVYDRARSGMQLAPDGQWAQEFGQLQQTVATLDPAAQNTFKTIANGIGARLKASGGTLKGDQYKAVVSKLGEKIGALRSNPRGDTELAAAVESLKEMVDDAARRQSDPAAVALLDQADAGYSKLVVIENAARRRGGQPGEFNGTSLDAAVQQTNKSRRSRAYLRGEATMQDYATAAKQLGDEVPDSGTPERLMTMGAVGGLGAINPMLAAPYAANTLLNVPGIRQGVGRMMAPSQSPSAQALAEQLRRRAYLGSIGGPLAVSE